MKGNTTSCSPKFMKEVSISRILACTLVAAGLGATGVHAQQWAEKTGIGESTLPGFRLYEVSLFSEYSSLAYPFSFGQTSTSNLGGIGGDAQFGFSASGGWQYRREKTSFGAVYSGNYTAMARHTDLNAYGQELSLTFNRSLGRKWNLNVSANGQDTTMAQYLFQPSILTTLSQAPATFTDLAATFAAGQYSNAQIASMLTGAPILESPARSLLFGNRILSYAATAGLSYSASSRLSFHLSSFTAAGQTRAGKSDAPQGANLMPRTIGGTLGMGLSYSLTPRTMLGLDVNEFRSSNALQGAWDSTAQASIGRKMGIHWFVRGYGGVSYLQVTHQPSAPTSTQVVGGGSLGFKTFRQTFLASYDRASTDSYGFAVGSNSTAGGSWTWRRPGTAWSVSSGFQHQDIRNTGTYSVAGWQGFGGVNRYLGGHSRMSIQYVYLNNSGTYLGSPNSLVVQSIRVSFGWDPQPAIH
jgi:hypothetical protein